MHTKNKKIMERRDFIRKSFGAAVTLAAMSDTLTSGIPDRNMPSDLQSYKELELHKIDGIEFTEIRLKYPRQVGKNAIKGIHGFGPTMTVATLKTDKGASGWGALRSNVNDSKAAFEVLKGKPVTDFFL
jgi:hypothetical protein